MPILLNGEEMKEAYGIEGEYGTMERVCLAQFKKVLEELEGYICAECSTPNFVNIVLPLKDWQSLKEELD